ncbi:hypothetical protein ACLB2K_046872 [Fragaria x ananassa]
MEGWDPNTKSTLTQIPLLTTKAGPRDGPAWTQRLKEEYKSLITYTQMNKSNDNDWFRISAPNPEGTRWTGTCWYVHNSSGMSSTSSSIFPSPTPPPRLSSSSPSSMEKPKSPRFGIAHALCLGLAPWLAAEIPILVDSGMVKHKDDAATSAES